MAGNNTQKIGLEFEFPMVNAKGECAGYHDDLRLWKAWKKLGYEYKRDHHTKKIVGIYKQLKSGKREIGTDYCAGTFEIAMPPEENLKLAKKEWEKFLKKECLPILNKNGLQLLGYASQPKTRHLKNKMAPKGHYQIWNELLAKNCAEWIRDKGSGFAAAQYNIDVPFNIISEVASALTKTTCLVWAWSLNDPISNSEITSFKSTRLKVYECIVKGGGFKNRGSFPDADYKSAEDYIDKAWKKPIFEIIRKGVSLQPQDRKLTTWDFIKKQEAVFVDLGGKKLTCRISTEDLALGLYFYWPSVRIKMFFDMKCTVQDIVSAVRNGEVEKTLTNRGNSSFLEIRPVAMTPQDELFTWPAFFLGLIENYKKLASITKDWKMSELENLMPDIQKRGLETVFKGKSLNDHGKTILKVSKQGLSRKYSELLPWLSPLEEKAVTKITPADRVMKIFDQRGMDGLIEYLVVR